MENLDEIKYEQAKKRVKEIKGFYTHALVYLVINTMLLLTKVQHVSEGENFLEFSNFSTAIFWGIGLLAHGLSVFLPNMLLGKDWEKRKIKELMDREKNSK